MGKTIRYALKITLPVLFGYLCLGGAFGLLVQQEGYNALWALLISVVLYAGSGQFLCVTFLAAGADLATVALMTLSINSRHMFYGLSFLEKFKQMGKAYPYMIYTLTDETYSLLCLVKTPEGMDENKLFFWISFLDQLYWVIGCVGGNIAGQLLGFDTKGVEFSMTALFVVLFVEQWREFKTHLPVYIGLLSALAALVLLGPANFILPALLVTIGLLLYFRPAITKQMHLEQEEPTCPSL